MKNKIIFLSFADNRYKPTLERLKREVDLFNCFDEKIFMTEKDFEFDFYNINRKRFKERGFGYFVWKPYIIKYQMAKLQNNDILLYADAGCILNINGKKRLYEYFDIVRKDESGILAFDQNTIEYQYTKGDLFDFLGVYNNKNITETTQRWAGSIIIRKCNNSIEFINKWFDICNNHYNLITDKESIKKNYNGFIEHRHDQSVFSILSKQYNTAIICQAETYSKNFNNLLKFPILAMRKKKMDKRSFFVHRLSSPYRIICRILKKIK